ncbi:hypothetical protein EDC96DRAFT_162417 [Choanephora cucurbitarum]|nr:hypothetical protein EDC96DRAFT_162417 [Choanephora cucurbitarum]
MKAIKDFYDHQKRVNDEINQLTFCAQELQAKKDGVFMKEDYIQLKTLSDQQRAICEKIKILQDKIIPEINKSVISGWKRRQEGLEQENICLEEVLRCLQAVKQDRERQHIKFTADIQRKTEEEIHCMEARQIELDSLRSSIAFDLDMWKQNDADLTEKIEEATHVEKEQKTILEQKSQELTNEIDQLRSRLKELESQHQTVTHQVRQLDHDINMKLQPFEHEIHEQVQERYAIDKRQQEVEEKALLLEQEEKELKGSISHYQQEQERSKQEIILLQNQIDDNQKKHMTTKQTQAHLTTLLSDVIMKKTEALLQHHALSNNLSNAISEKMQTIKSIQSDIYQAEQNSIQYEDSVYHFKQQLSSLEKRKKLALENNEFETAAILASQIRETDIALSNLVTTQKDTSKIALDQAQLIKEKNTLQDMRHQLDLLKASFKEKLEADLADAKSTLFTVLQSNEDVELGALIQCEIDSI